MDSCTGSSSNVGIREQKSEVTGTIEKELTLLTDTLVSEFDSDLYFHYYYSNAAKTKDNVNVYLIFDPAAKGNQQIKKWKAWANDNSGLLISVDDFRNGMDIASATFATNKLIDVINKALKKSTSYFALGFSGGARFAANLHESSSLFNGVILCCAAPSSSQIDKQVVLYTADQDMNFLECLKHYQSANENASLHLFIDNDKHAWPKPETMALLITYLRAENKKKHLSNFAHANISQEVFEYENKAQNTIRAAYFKEPLAYWQMLLTQYTISKNLSDKRLLAYTSLLSYGPCNKTVNENNHEAANYALQIYEWADPANNEWMYLRSIYFLQENNVDKAFEMLEKAINSGFIQQDRLARDSNWEKHTNDPRYNNLFSKMKFN
jgi:hypothetical protein